jgi:hypothetical protein
MSVASSLIAMGYALLLLFSEAHAETIKVKVNADGSFDRQVANIHDGDTVEWQLADTARDSIIPVRTDLALGQSPDSGICIKYKSYSPTGVNEFTGPLPRTPSGIFVLGPNEGQGFVVKSGAAQCDPTNHPECGAAVAGSGATTQCLCTTGKPYAAMDATWADLDVTGVFIRLPWSAVHKGPGKFFWGDLDREIDKAVKKGKLYSLAFSAGSQGTPEWIFRPLTQAPLAPPLGNRKRRAAPIADTTVPQAVKRLHFRDGGSKLGGGECGPKDGMDLGSPADDNYRKYYFEMLRTVAAHLKEKNAWYRALAYIKPSGLNLISNENRLPNSCEPGCLCNTEVWAKDEVVGYTPTALKQFYEEQMRLLADEFPDKDMSYALIQAGFPQVNDFGEYLGQSGVQPWTAAEVPEDKCSFPKQKGKLPGGTQQTECVLQVGKRNHGKRFVVQHNGLGPLCGDGPDEDSADDCLPNRWAKDAGKDGHIVGFQTNNATGVVNPEQLDAAFQNGYCNSDATFFEIYEQRLWEARMKTGGVLGNAIARCSLPVAAPRNLSGWAAMLHARREQRHIELGLLQAFPPTHRGRFARTISTNKTQLLYYVHGSKCNDAPNPKYGVIAILPTVTSQADSLFTTAASGYQAITSISPPGKPTDAVVHSRALATSDNRLGLKGFSLGEHAGIACSLSLAFQDLPGSPKNDTTLGMTTTLSGSETCSASAGSTKTATLAGVTQFVRGVSVCTSGAIPQVRAIRIFAANVSDDGTASAVAQTSETLTLGTCSNWQTARYCPQAQVAVGVKSYFTASGGYTGIALQCKGLEAH